MSTLRLLKLVTKGYLNSYRKKTKIEKDEPIDFVVTWVDGNDPQWIEQRNKYLEKTDENGNGMCRYRDWDSFIYWFRAVEKYAPWVRHVYLVTCGHVPKWLNVESTRLKIVKHTDFIPEEFLPTFNCNTIELNLFRIPGLSENFVYFNDDVLLCRPVDKKDFFASGKPRHTAVAIPYINRDNEIPYHLFFNTYGMINRKNNIQKCIEQYSEKWFSHVYGMDIKHNLFAWKYAGLSSMFFTHMAVPFCKSTMEETWEKYREVCVDTCKYKFRNINQITHQIFSIEDILNGNFYPIADEWGSCVAIEDTKALKNAYKSRKKKMVCLFDRDNFTEEEIVTVNKKMVSVFEEFLFSKSEFEK